MSNGRLVLKFGGSLVEQLGAQLYPSATATVAELISNAWDADAENVWVTMPLGDSWKPESEIVVLDDGHGMSREDAQAAYLVVGRKRRLGPDGDRSRGGRLVHGRKGIGKLAAFGTAGILECISKAGDSERAAFRLDYDQIRKLDPNQDYEVEDIEEDAPLNDPDGEALEHGTRIRLTNLLLKRAASEEQFIQSMSRRFSLAQGQMNVFINGHQLQRFDVSLQFRFPNADECPEGTTLGEDGWGEDLIGGKKVRWWIGFTDKPLDDESMLGISVLARGKMAQRPFKFEHSLGTEGQLGLEYLVGEVEADWLDEGIDIETDLIQSNRDQLRLEDSRLVPLLDWGRQRLRWSLRERNQLRMKVNLREIESPEIRDLLNSATRTERAQLFKLASAIAKFPEMEPENVRDIVRGVMDAREDVAVRSLMDEISAEDEPFQERMWQLVHEFGLIDARRNLSLIEARIATIQKLDGAVRGGAREVPDLHRMVRENAWLIDPRWQLLDDEVDVATFGVDYEPQEDEDGNQLDFLFALRPSPPAALDEVVVIEIKRGTNRDGSVHRASDDEVDKFVSYVLAVEDHLGKNSSPPSVRGLMIASDYTKAADRKRKSYDQIVQPRMEFKTWELVIAGTRNMHEGWLAVSTKRSGGGEQGRS